MSAALLALALATAHAFEATGSAWEPEDVPVPYWVSADMGPLDDDDALAAIQAAFETWSSAECGIAFAYQGRVDDAPFGGAPDGRNVVSFVTTGWSDEPALASAPIIIVDGPALLEVDVGFNGQYYTWATEGADGRTALDLQGGMTHEVGHMLGLWHSAVSGATLNPAMAGNPEAATLEPDDLDGLCYLYASLGEGGDVGDYCDENRDCTEGLECVADGSQRYCSTTCTSDDTCPEGFSCLADYCVTDTGCGSGCASVRSPAAAAAALLGLAAVLGLRRRRHPITASKASYSVTE